MYVGNGKNVTQQNRKESLEVLEIFYNSYNR